MKAIFISDIHMHNYKQFNARGERMLYITRILDYVFKFADANKIVDIFMPGDIFDQFGNVSVLALLALLHCLRKNFKEYPNIKWYGISGNHDMATKTVGPNYGISSQAILSFIFPANYTLLDGMNRINPKFIVMGVPHYEDPNGFWDTVTRLCGDLVKLGNERKAPVYLMMHQMVWPENPMVPDDVNFEDNRFKFFTRIFNGHVHHMSIVSDTFINVGSPIHRDAGDVGKRKGFWIVELDDPNVIPKFWDITEKAPEIIRKPYGEAVTGWEKDQHIIWFHPEAAIKKKSQVDFDSSKFTTQLTPEELVVNYCKEVKPDDRKLREMGVKFVQS